MLLSVNIHAKSWMGIDSRLTDCLTKIGCPHRLSRLKNVPQRLKPIIFRVRFGITKVVPFQGLIEATGSCLIACLLAAASLGAAAHAQTGATPLEAGAASSAAPVEITLPEAIRRAEASEPAFAAAKAASQSAGLDRSIARAGLLPNARLYSQDIYTEPNGIYTEGDAGEPLAPLPRFVANDSRPREYMAQGIVDETLSFAGPAAVRRANAAAAMASAEQEIARRGLVVAVTGMFYARMAADRKLAVAESAQTEAAGFTKLTREREQAREAAHADVVRADLQEQQRDRDVEDARVAAEKARLDLAVLLFADPLTPYTLKAPEAAPPLASKEDVEQAAAKNNPELKSALASLAESNADVQAAWGALLPSVGLNVTYGIDANEFAVNGPLTPDGLRARNLGYSTSATVNLPVWDWLSPEHKVKQSEIRRDAAQVALTNAQRQMIAQLEEVYSEARAALDQLASLDQSVTTAAESLRLTKLAYQGGDGTALEVVDAENAYVTAENARQDGRVRYETARAELETLTGTM
jgi:outer membrane protein TolC